MEVRSFLKRISSRKFIIAMIGVVVGLATTFGIKESEWATISGTVCSIASILGFAFSEGMVDAASAQGASIKGLIEEAEAKAEDEEAEKKEEGGV